MNIHRVTAKPRISPLDAIVDREAKMIIEARRLEIRPAKGILFIPPLSRRTEIR